MIILLKWTALYSMKSSVYKEKKLYKNCHKNCSVKFEDLYKCFFLKLVTFCLQILFFNEMKVILKCALDSLNKYVW